jgi:hypothetical protein
VSVDSMGTRAAADLRAASQVDCEASLAALHRLDRRRRTQRRRATLACGLTVAVAIGMISRFDSSDGEAPEPLPRPSFTPLGGGYDVIDSDVSPTGLLEAVATFREGQPAVVLVRAADAGSYDVAWSAPTSHELGREDPPWPAAVSWRPDGSRLAVLTAQERDVRHAAARRVELTLLTVNPDGTERRAVAEVGTCRCSADQPAMTWSRNQVAITIPDGPDQGLHTTDMP